MRKLPFENTSQHKFLNLYLDSEIGREIHPHIYIYEIYTNIKEENCQYRIYFSFSAVITWN